MVKRDFGLASRHVLVSTGADTDPLKFYCTEAATSYGRRFSKFEPRSGRHVGTGYQSNFRPGVYYTPKIDILDNPRFVPLLADNYSSVTTKHYRPYALPDGNEPNPHLCKQAGSGFQRSAQLSIPTHKEVNDACFGRRIASAPADVMPRAVPHLHKIQPKDPIEAENQRYGPACLRTETKAVYRGEPSDRRVYSADVLGGPGLSGFVHNANIEPVTFHPDKAHAPGVPAWFTPRPTGVSVTTTSYRPTQMRKGSEPLPRLAERADHGTGFTTGNPQATGHTPTKPDSSSYRDTYKGAQRPDKTVPDGLHKTTIGNKDESGFTENNMPFVATYDNPARFITDNHVRFLDRTAAGGERAGHTWGGVLPPRPDAYTRDVRLHGTGSASTTVALSSLRPYVARSIQQSDRFFDDHTYDSKINIGLGYDSLIEQC